MKHVENNVENVENHLTDSDDNICLIVDSLIEIEIKITGSNNITLTMVNIKPYLIKCI